MYASPHISPPTCSSTTAKHSLLSLPPSFAIPSFSLTDLCGGNSFNNFCNNINNISSSESIEKQNIINNNNNTKVTFKQEDPATTCLSRSHESCSRSFFDYIINGGEAAHEKIYPSKIQNNKIDTKLKICETHYNRQESITKTQKFKNNGKPRHMTYSVLL
jgi:hypothetical protein